MRIEEPALSKDFTVEDIHKLREYNYLRRKDMSREEIIEETNRSAYEFLKLLSRKPTKIS
ncbi:MAG: hypothetical protein HFG27_07835 [Provencibacterium sp.]|jgi:hypothetical protein|nr:hypothetical protein [Provencibacterium sp.]